MKVSELIKLLQLAANGGDPEVSASCSGEGISGFPVVTVFENGAVDIDFQERFDSADQFPGKGESAVVTLEWVGPFEVEHEKQRLAEEAWLAQTRAAHAAWLAAKKA